MGTTCLVLAKVLLINGTIQQNVPDEDGRLLHLDASMTGKKLHYPQCINTASDWWITVSTIGLRKISNM